MSTQARPFRIRAGYAATGRIRTYWQASLFSAMDLTDRARCAASLAFAEHVPIPIFDAARLKEIQRNVLLV